MKTINVGIIGLGNMGKHHVRNYASLPGVTITAVCDIQQDIADAFATQYHCKGFATVKEMISNADIDAVSITVPTRFHYDIATEFISAGIHVLIEKPIAGTLSDAEALIALAKKHTVILTVGHIERFNPAVTKLKELLDAGAIGKVTSLIAKRVGAFPAQIKDANVVIDLAVHDIDIFSYLLDKAPDTITGNAGRALIDGREDYAEIFLSYGDQNGFIQVNWITPIRIRNLAITGTKGYIELNYMTQELTMYESNYSADFDTFGDYIIKFGTPNKTHITVEKQEPLHLELSHFMTCIRENRPPLISGQTGYNALETALTVMKKMNIT